ncbi:MAG: LytTR family DNA-binding domain-containing protein [Pseudomonadota bacterium]
MSDRPSPAKKLSDPAFDILACGLIFLSYLSVFWFVRQTASALDLVTSSLINLTPLVILTAAVRPVIRRKVIGARAAVQVLSHICLAVVFTIAWHWMLLILIGIRDGESFTDFSVKAFFPEPVVAWQFLQGVTVYALVASLTYLRAKPPMPEFVETTAADWQEQERTLRRYFIRQGDDIQPIDVEQVISIVGADDYAEVSTADGQHLVRTTLAKFEASLDPDQFLRIHRSRIVNLHQIERAESAGDGRILLYMANGETIHSSRTGAKLLRDRVF